MEKQINKLQTISPMRRFPRHAMAILHSPKGNFPNQQHQYNRCVKKRNNVQNMQ